MSFSMITLSVLALLRLIFKYVKNKQKKTLITSGSHEAAGSIFEGMVNLVPLWVAKTVIALISIGVIFFGVMILFT